MTPRDAVEAKVGIGSWPVKAPPTDGYLRNALRVVGIDPKDMSREQMEKAAKEAGLPFKWEKIK